MVWDLPKVELHMNATGTVYHGEVDLARGLIEGQDYFGGKKCAELELRLGDPDEIPLSQSSSSLARKLDPF